MKLVPIDYDLALKAEREIADQLFKFEIIKESAEVMRERDIRHLAKSLFITYFDTEERDEVFFGPGHDGAQHIVEEYCEKAEKIYNFFRSLSSAQRMLDFLQAIDPKVASLVIENL